MRPKAYAAPVDVVVTTRYRLTMAVAVVCVTVFVPHHSHARDDGRFANSPLKEWFDRLASRNGLCCAFADGVSVQDVDWARKMVTIAYEFRENGLRCLTPT